MDFRCFHITTERMEELALECIGYAICPYFEPQIVHQSDLIPQIKELIDLIENGSYCDLQKEELLYMIIGDLVADYTQSLEYEQMEISDSVERACGYIERHYATNISLCDLSSFTGFSKYHFIRMFTKEKGISPYRYIECIKMTEAKKLLKAGEDLSNITYQLGFSSQSHFTNFFKKYARVTMGGDFDFMDERSHHTAGGLTEAESRNRECLRHIMESSGFEAYCNEWWHYVLADEPYPDTYFNFCIS